MTQLELDFAKRLQLQANLVSHDKPIILPDDVMVNEPPHYRQGGIETIDVIEAWGLGFHLGNAVKYISRAGRKDPTKYTEDLRKAVWYLQRAIEKAGKP